MRIEQNVSLKPYNTFGINVKAKQVISFSDTDELEEICALLLHSKSRLPPLVLGGGSNMLFTQDYDGIILKNELKGITLTGQDQHYYYVKAAAGENWHQFVLHCIANAYAGVENLSLIPGNTGAGPMQNIGAYGVELQDVFYELEAHHIADNEAVTFSAEECAFGYRDSVFKHKYKGQFIITSVTFKLLKQPDFKTDYGAIQQELDKMGVQQLSLQSVSQAVVKIRQSKLPDPAVTGNAGSFFKNPVIPNPQFDLLKSVYPQIVAYPADDDHMKVAAGWLIEQCGWKGYRRGDAGCHEKQALVLVNYGNANGLDIFGLSTDIMHSVEERFGILMEREVNIY